MAAPIRAFFHTSQVTTSRAVTNAFAAAVVHNHDLLADAVPFMASRAFNCRLEGIVVQLSSIHDGRLGSLLGGHPGGSDDGGCEGQLLPFRQGGLEHCNDGLEHHYVVGVVDGADTCI